jgi:hypothetical protein
MNGTLFLDGKQYHYTDPEHLKSLLERDYPNEEIPHWALAKLQQIEREVKRVPVVSPESAGI